MRWSLLLTPPMSGIENMAMDDALLSRARQRGEGVVRVYEWATPTLSLGRNQRARGVYTAERASAHGVTIVRRATGGRALLHHREITYSVTAPADNSESLTASYRAINLALLAALQAMGVDAALAHRHERLPPPESAPCFEHPANGELTWRGRKLAGSAQLREAGALLQHGSILVRDDQALVVDLASAPVGRPAAAATLAEAMAREPTAAEFAQALFSVVRAHWDPDARELVPDAPLLHDARAAANRFASDTWTWRR